MKKIWVGSQNPVKIEAVRDSFLKYFDNVEVNGMNVLSGVNEQPVNEETFIGAKNRAFYLRDISGKDNSKADFYVGIEGGITRLYERWFALGIMCVIDNRGRIGYGTSPLFELPDSITEELLDGTELGDVMDRLTGEGNTKQKGGAIGFFTKGVMDRKELYVQGLITALIPFLNEELYF